MQNYTIYDEIGRGTMSFVYKARRKRSIEYVAVKSTDKTRMDKILNEVQILHRLDSRHVLKFFNWYESTNHIWLIFEYCIGGDLLKLITQDRRLPEPAVKAFGWQLVGGLQYLHANSILYCDLKPANILIDECGSLKLADFGLARRIPTAESILTTPLAPGSPNYMAPELFQPPAIHSFASDFWALGCVLFELVTGRQPFTHTFFPELARIIQTEPLVIPEDEVEISSDFRDLLHKLLEKDPYRRITWPQLRTHPFWAGCAPLDVVELPAQELFEAARHDRHHEIVGESLSIAIPSPQDAAYPHHSLGEEKPVASPATESASDRSPSGRPSDNDDDDSSDRDAEDRTHRSDNGHLEEDEDSNEIVSGDDNATQRRPVTAPLLTGATSQRDGGRNGGDALTERSGPNTENASGRATRTAPVGAGRRQPLQPTTARRASLTKVSRLLFLAADSAVKPIAYSGDIEDIVTLRVEPDQLEFDALSAEELLACATEDLEDHLKSIYISLKSNEASAKEKTNMLAHLFSLSLHPRLANVIVNSSLLALLIKLLNHSSQNMASPSIQVKRDVVTVTSAVTLVLGVLFRFATFVSSTSPDNILALVTRLSDIVSIQSGETTNTRDGVLELKAKRHAMACLGELLFYLASQEDSKIPAAGATFLLKILDDGDVVTRHYAIRTVANILTRGAGVAPALVHEHTVLALLRPLLKAKEMPDERTLLLQTSAMQALAQVFRHIRLNSSPSATSAKTKVAAMMALWKTSVLASLWDGVSSGKTAPDLAIASLNVLNAYLEMNLDQHDDEGAQAIVTKHKRTLLKKFVKIPVLESLLEAKSKFDEDDQTRATRADENAPGRRYKDDGRALPSLLRAKSLLFIYFAIQRSGDFARLFVREQLLDKVELLLAPYSATLRAGGFSPQSSSSRRQGSDSAVSSPRQLPPADHYLVQCGLNLVRLSIRTALKMGAECISSSDKVDYEDKSDQGGTQSHASSVASEPFQLINQLIKNPTCRGQLCRYFLVNEGREFRFFVRLMSKLLTSFATEKLVAMRATVGAVISRLLLRFFRSSPSDAAALVVAESEEIFMHLLPAIVVQLQHAAVTQGNDGDHSEDEEDDDHSANCIQLVHLVMIQLPLDLNDATVYARDEFARKHLLPCFHALFGSGRLNENVWRVAIDLLHGLVIYDPQLIGDFESSGLIAPVVVLLSWPKEHHYHSLPASATALVRIIVETSKKANTISILHAHQIARHVTDGLEFAVESGAMTSGTVDLLDALYLLLYNRYEERRKASDSSASPDFEHLVWTGPLLVHLCANADGSSDDVDSNGKKNHLDAPANSAHHEVLESASRCLVYVSQLFGSHLNEVLFEKARPPSHKDQVTRDLTKCLRLTQHEAVLLRVLLTIKNSLRCVKKNETPLARRWLQSDRSAMKEVVRISKWERKSPSASPEHNRSRDQVIKAASDILSLLQTATATK